MNHYTYENGNYDGEIRKQPNGRFIMFLDDEGGVRWVEPDEEDQQKIRANDIKNPGKIKPIVQSYGTVEIDNYNRYFTTLSDGNIKILQPYYESQFYTYPTRFINGKTYKRMTDGYFYEEPHYDIRNVKKLSFSEPRAREIPINKPIHYTEAFRNNWIDATTPAERKRYDEEKRRLGQEEPSPAAPEARQRQQQPYTNSNARQREEEQQRRARQQEEESRRRAQQQEEQQRRAQQEEDSRRRASSPPPPAAAAAAEDELNDSVNDPKCPSYNKNPVPCNSKKDYYKQALIFHPDRNSVCEKSSGEKFKQLQNICSDFSSSGGKKRKTNKRKTNKRKTIKRKTNKNNKRKVRRSIKKQRGGIMYGTGYGANCYDPNYSIYNTNMLKLFPYSAK